MPGWLVRQDGQDGRTHVSHRVKCVCFSGKGCQGLAWLASQLDTSRRADDDHQRKRGGGFACRSCRVRAFGK